MNNITRKEIRMKKTKKAIQTLKKYTKSSSWRTVGLSIVIIAFGIQCVLMLIREALPSSNAFVLSRSFLTVYALIMFLIFVLMKVVSVRKVLRKKEVKNDLSKM